MFYLIFGLSILTMICGFFTIDRDIPSTEDRRVDWIGASLVTSGLVLIVFVLSDGSIAPQGWKTSYIIALLIIGILLIAAFLVWEAYLERAEKLPGARTSVWTPPPLMRLSVWGRAKGKLAVMLVIGFLEWCSFMSFVFWVQLYYQDFRHLSPIDTMIRLLPMFVTGLLCNVIVALFVGRVDFVILVVTGTAMTALANLLFAVIRVDSPYWAFGFPAAIVSVFGADFVFAAGSIFVAKVSLPHEQSVSGALLQTMMQCCSSEGPSVLPSPPSSSILRWRVDPSTTKTGIQEIPTHPLARKSGPTSLRCGEVLHSDCSARYWQSASYVEWVLWAMQRAAVQLTTQKSKTLQNPKLKRSYKKIHNSNSSWIDE